MSIVSSGLVDPSGALALGAAILLGVRHATDPDHIAAVSTLVLEPADRCDVQAGVLGGCWGLGHAATMLGLGIPMIVVGRSLPGFVPTLAELMVGLLISAFAIRLMMRWQGSRAGAPGAARAHAHAAPLGRSPLECFGVGLVHGVGGSGGPAVLLAASIPEPRGAVAALAFFSLGTAASMIVMSVLVWRLVARGVIPGTAERAVPAFAGLSLAFGLWYAFEALRVLG